MSAALHQVSLTCSSCDDYRFVPGADGMLERCPDCLHVTAVRCPAHGRSLREGKCPQCSYEATVAEERIVEFGVGRKDLATMLDLPAGAAA